MSRFRNFPPCDNGDLVSLNGQTYVVNRSYGAKCEDGSATMIELTPANRDLDWQYLTSKQFKKLNSAPAAGDPVPPPTNKEKTNVYT